MRTENCVQDESCGVMDGPTVEVTCEGNKEEVEDLGSFTCQRVQVYIRKEHVSCARTHMSWPFSNAGSTGSSSFTPDTLSTPVTSSPLPAAISPDESSTDQDGGWIEIRLNGISTNFKHTPVRRKALFSRSSEEVVNGDYREENQGDMRDEVEEGNEQVPPPKKLKAPSPPDVGPGPCSSFASDGDDAGASAASTPVVGTGPWSSFGSDGDDAGASADEGPQSSAGDKELCSQDNEVSETDQATAEAAEDVLDEFTAYKQDILLVSAKQDDSELFENLPEEDVVKQGLPQMQDDASDESIQR